jgi:hypothetical protein
MITILKKASLIGLVIAAIAWAANTQIAYALVSAKCEQSFDLVPLIGLTSFSALLIGSTLTWPAYSSTSRETSSSGQPRKFIATISLGAAGLFALGIILQAVAGFIIVCQR